MLATPVIQNAFVRTRQANSTERSRQYRQQTYIEQDNKIRYDKIT